MSKHRRNIATDPPAVYGSAKYLDQVVAVISDRYRVEVSLTPAAAAELARILVQYGSAVRTEKAPAPSPSQKYDPDLWHDVGLAVNTGVNKAAAAARPVGRGMSPATVSRYLAPSGRRRRTATLVMVGDDQ